MVAIKGSFGPLGIAHWHNLPVQEKKDGMTIEPRERNIGIAMLRRVRPDLIEVHYAPGCMLDGAGLSEVRKARQELMGRQPYGMLSILPEDADFALPAMKEDHLAEDRREGYLQAIALVVRTSMIEMVLKLYFSYYPQMSRIHVTEHEAEAREWLEEQLRQVGRTG